LPNIEDDGTTRAGEIRLKKYWRNTNIFNVPKPDVSLQQISTFESL
jgi:hypothetical protein